VPSTFGYTSCSALALGVPFSLINVRRAFSLPTSLLFLSYLFCCFNMVATSFARDDSYVLLSPVLCSVRLKLLYLMYCFPKCSTLHCLKLLYLLYCCFDLDTTSFALAKLLSSAASAESTSSPRMRTASCERVCGACICKLHKSWIECVTTVSSHPHMHAHNICVQAGASCRSAHVYAFMCTYAWLHAHECVSAHVHKHAGVFCLHLHVQARATRGMGDRVEEGRRALSSFIPSSSRCQSKARQGPFAWHQGTLLLGTKVLLLGTKVPLPGTHSQVRTSEALGSSAPPNDSRWLAMS